MIEKLTRCLRSILPLVFGVLLAVTATLPVAAQQPIKIGFSMGLTGAYAGNGKAALLATQMWAEDQNAKGGLLGRPVKLFYYDDQSNPSNVPGIYVKLLDVDKVDLLISGYGTNIITPGMTVAVPRNMVFMSLAGMEVNKQFKYDKYFQIYPFGPDAESSFSQGFFDVAMGMNPKPKTAAIVYAESEFTHTAATGAREWAKKHGLKNVYDRSFPANTVDFAPIVRALQSVNADVVYIACFPPNTVGIVRAVHEIGYKPMIIGGGMVGPQYASIKQQLGPLLNGFVNYDSYVPEPTTEYPGIKAFLARYKPKAIAEGIDPLGYYLPPFSYAGMQIIADAVEATKSLDQNKIGQYIHKNAHKTIVGDVKFRSDGEWTETRVLQVQFQNIKNNELAQFERAGTQVILFPTALKTGTLKFPLGK